MASIHSIHSRFNQIACYELANKNKEPVCFRKAHLHHHMQSVKLDVMLVYKGKMLRNIFKTKWKVVLCASQKDNFQTFLKYLSLKIEKVSELYFYFMCVTQRTPDLVVGDIYVQIWLNVSILGAAQQTCWTCSSATQSFFWTISV